MKLPFVSKNKEPRHPWQWHSCNHPKTLSFHGGDTMFKTVNSVFFDDTPDGSWFTNSSTSECPSFSTESEESTGESVEVIIRGVQSDRLFFEPGGTSSILEEAKGAKGFVFKESVVMAMESDDPYVDFRRSMEEMVESHGVRDWECLEELLGWYLRVNGKVNHGFIVGAFIDLLMGLDSSSSSDSTESSTSYSSAVASFSSPPPHSSILVSQKEITEEEE